MSKPTIDKIWPLRQGVIGIHLNPTKEEDDKLRAEIRKNGKRAKVPGHIPMVINLYDHIFGKNIWVAMGDRAKCEWMLRQLTDTKGDLTARLQINCGMCFSMKETDIGIWVKETWHELRDAANATHLSHEALHACEVVMDLAGMRPHRQNEELRAYYQEWICETIIQLIQQDIGIWDAAYISVKSLYEKTP